jgi:outer membrane lipoprotein SlyB
MRIIKHLPLFLCLAFSPLTFADQVIRAVPDTTTGKSVGALSGLMLGGATGGPVGAVAGAGIGFWLGASAQQGAGLSEAAYEIESLDGTRSVVRSPNSHFEPGQTVTRKGLRLYAEQP